MNIHLFKDIKRNDCYYWFTDESDGHLTAEKRKAGAADSFEDALISIGRAMIIHNLQISKIFYENVQINKQTWDMAEQKEEIRDLV
jgi:hypothetical protein